MSEHEYDDIIHLSRPISKTHKPMSREERAAQFMPFAALNGYEKAIEETARTTSEKIVLSDESKETISTRLSFLKAHLKEKMNVSLTYFVKDKAKDGGEYVTDYVYLKQIDELNHSLLLSNEKKIQMDDILSIQGEVFDAMEESF